MALFLSWIYFSVVSVNLIDQMNIKSDLDFLKYCAFFFFKENFHSNDSLATENCLTLTEVEGMVNYTKTSFHFKKESLHFVLVT